MLILLPLFDAGLFLTINSSNDKGLNYFLQADVNNYSDDVIKGLFKSYVSNHIDANDNLIYFKVDFNTGNTKIQLVWTKWKGYN